MINLTAITRIMPMCERCLDACLSITSMITRRGVAYTLGGPKVHERPCRLSVTYDLAISHGVPRTYP